MTEEEFRTGKSATAIVGCKCKDEVNAHLAQHNGRLQNNLLDDTTIFIETAKLDEKKRGKPPAMIATFCPFCGEKLPNKERIR